MIFHYNRKKLLKRTERMPRRKIPMKDVMSYDKLRGAAKYALYPEISEWGNLSRVISVSIYLNI